MSTASNLKTRLDILLQGGAIGNDAHRRLTLVLSWLNSKGDLFQHPNHTETFFTHLSMATNRMLLGEPLTDADDSDLDDIRDGGRWDDVMALYGELQHLLGLEFPDGEAIFLKVYLNLMIMD